MPSSAIKFPSLLVLFVLLPLLLSSCKEEIVIQKDPGMLTAGDYSVTGTVSYTIAGEVSTTPVSGTLSVYTADRPDSYYFLEKLKGFSELGYRVNVSGAKISVESVYDKTKYKSTWYYGKQDGVGLIATKRVSLDRYANTNVTSITSPSGEQIKYVMDIRKHISFTAVL